MKACIITLLLMAVYMAMQAQNIVQAEYFIDKDKGVGNNTFISITPATDGSFPFTAKLDGVAQGYHTLFIRTKDEAGHWSLAARKSIEVMLTTANTVTKGEYFFDDDPGFDKGNIINVATPDSLLLQNFTANLAAIEAGYHKMFLRTKDANGNWSVTSRYNIEVVKDESGGKVFMVEYFFDKDPGIGNCASAIFATSAADGTFTFTIPQNNIPANPVNLFVRVKDSSNYQWSITAWKNFSTLPLTLLSFTAQKQIGSALLQWQTTNEINTFYFNIQRSADGLQFTNVGKVYTKGSRSNQNNYSYTDNVSGLQAGNVYYRLQLVDKDGKISYSSIANIIISEDGAQIVIYPNPAHQFFFVDNLNLASNAYIIIKDLAGRNVLTKKISGTGKQQINVSSLSKGIYMVTIVLGNQTETKKLAIE